MAGQLQCEYSAGWSDGCFGTFVQTVITWSFEDKVFRTRGLDADQTEAAIKATVKLLNLIEEDYKDLESHV